jgi:hypothetical protein
MTARTAYALNDRVKPSVADDRIRQTLAGFGGVRDRVRRSEGSSWTIAEATVRRPRGHRLSVCVDLDAADIR